MMSPSNRNGDPTPRCTVHASSVAQLSGVTVLPGATQTQYSTPGIAVHVMTALLSCGATATSVGGGGGLPFEPQAMITAVATIIAVKARKFFIRFRAAREIERSRARKS